MYSSHLPRSPQANLECDSRSSHSTAILLLRPSPLLISDKEKRRLWERNWYEIRNSCSYSGLKPPIGCVLTAFKEGQNVYFDHERNMFQCENCSHQAMNCFNHDRNVFVIVHIVSHHHDRYRRHHRRRH